MDPIIALATPPLKSALALLRLSGEGVFDAVSKSLDMDLETFLKRKIQVGYLKHKGQIIDQVVCFIYVAPNSFTGEDSVEITCHGSMVIAKEILSHFYSLGIRQAERGEFSARAFYNGKLDLIEAEAVNDLINASTIESKNVAMLSLKGETSSLLYPVLKQIDEMLALIEVNIDYPEYTDIEEVNLSKIAKNCESLREDILSLIKEGNEGKIVREGIKVAIVGEPNVGKSSLLNALVEEEKAIVSSIPGTTRDIVEGDISVKGIPLHLLDTAGIRESKDYVENLGIERSRDAIKNADLVLLILDSNEEEKGSDLIELCEGKECIRVYNKADLLSEEKKKDGRIYISATNKDIGELKEAIYQKLGLSDKAFHAPSFSNARELALLEKIADSLFEAKNMCEANLTSDLISSCLQEARLYGNEIIGKEASLDLSEEIFSRFCVGK
ncbi:MAG: tRNA uridine-5-carboxymethylaminomethyl(34) synthesis GTPase MnmE [Bacilli bacterium]|nr:tRNA uridine-5-carboxymethylaminomethyl(34) synthesis GTPase MnmE [Bacilli bacterium]